MRENRTQGSLRGRSGNWPSYLDDEQDRVRHDTPEHKINLGVRTKLGGGWTGNLAASWVDKTERLISDLAGNEYMAEVDPYIVVNGWIGYAFWQERGEVSLAVFNMFNDKHYEYPPGINLPDTSSDPVGTQALLKVSWRF